MTERRIRVDLFAEDVAHERFLGALVGRLATETGITAEVKLRSARGGYGAALGELKLYQRAVQSLPDVLVAAIDANCSGWDAKRKEVAGAVDHVRFPALVVACPDPHIERWFLADPLSLHVALGARVRRERRKCARDIYKQALAAGLREAGHILTLGGAEFADEIVEAMDLYRAGKNEPSLKHCIDGIRAALRAGAL